LTYFCFADTVSLFEGLDKWLRRRLRQVRWKEWKRPQTRYRNRRALGIPERDARSWAASQKGYWRIAGPDRFRPACRTPIGTSGRETAGSAVSYPDLRTGGFAGH
jgi:Group II intron, maturase-specific domain